MPHDPDPLLEFSAEPAAAAPPESAASVSQAEPVEVAETPEKAAQSVVMAQDPPVAAAAAEDDGAYRDLTVRVSRAERLLDRSLLEITALKSDLATLVTTLDDIRKHQTRVEALPLLPLPPSQMPRPRPILSAVVLVAAVGLGWGVMSIASSDVAESPPIESTTDEPASTPTPAPAPVADVAPPVVDIAPAASPAAVAAPPVVAPAVAAPERKAQPARDPPARLVARANAGYVGTLTIDASPAGEVLLNRKSVGRTPLRLENLRAGSHLIWIERDGYRRWTRVVPVTADRISRVSATLDPLSQ